MTRNNSQYLLSLGRCKSISKELGKPPYSVVYMKEKLQGHFGEKIAIITVNNRNDVTFRSTVATIISKFYKQPKVDDYEVEQIIKESSWSEEILDLLRYSRSCQQIKTRTSFVQLECLPPYFYNRCLPQPQGLPPGTAVERC